MDTVSKSWFCVFNNPEEHGIEGEPQEVVDIIIEIWIEDNPQRSCAVTYCISEDGLKHCHAVFEDSRAMRFTVIKKLFPSMHIEPTKGSKEQAEDYINKKGKWEEKGEIIICSARHGEIKGSQGQRRDLDIIDDLLQQGKRPNYILSMSFSYYRYENMIRNSYYRKRYNETSVRRDLKTYYHVGLSGTGKSYSYVELCERYGADDVYLVTDYDHPFDKYNGERVIFLDEFRGQVKYSYLLNTILSNYRVQVAARYSNVYALWTEIHITSILPPECIYEKMVQNYQNLDTYEQLKRRLDYIVLHYKNDGEYYEIVCPMADYVNYCQLQNMVDSFPWSVNLTYEQLEISL